MSGLGDLREQAQWARSFRGSSKMDSKSSNQKNTSGSIFQSVFLNGTLSLPSSSTDNNINSEVLSKARQVLGDMDVDELLKTSRPTGSISPTTHNMKQIVNISDGDVLRDLDNRRGLLSSDLSDEFNRFMLLENDDWFSETSTSEWKSAQRELMGSLRLNLGSLNGLQDSDQLSLVSDSNVSSMNSVDASTSNPYGLSSTINEYTQSLSSVVSSLANSKSDISPIISFCKVAEAQQLKDAMNTSNYDPDNYTNELLLEDARTRLWRLFLYISGEGIVGNASRKAVVPYPFSNSRNRDPKKAEIYNVSDLSLQRDLSSLRYRDVGENVLASASSLRYLMELHLHSLSSQSSRLVEGDPILSTVAYVRQLLSSDLLGPVLRAAAAETALQLPELCAPNQVLSGMNGGDSKLAEVPTPIYALLYYLLRRGELSAAHTLASVVFPDAGGLSASSGGPSSLSCIVEALEAFEICFSSVFAAAAAPEPPSNAQLQADVAAALEERHFTALAECGLQFQTLDARARLTQQRSDAGFVDPFLLALLALLGGPWGEPRPERTARASAFGFGSSTAQETHIIPLLVWNQSYFEVLFHKLWFVAALPLVDAARKALPVSAPAASPAPNGGILASFVSIFTSKTPSNAAGPLTANTRQPQRYGPRELALDALTLAAEPTATEKDVPSSSLVPFAVRTSPFNVAEILVLGNLPEYAIAHLATAVVHSAEAEGASAEASTSSAGSTGSKRLRGDEDSIFATPHLSRSANRASASSNSSSTSMRALADALHAALALAHHGLLRTYPVSLAARAETQRTGALPEVARFAAVDGLAGLLYAYEPADTLADANNPIADVLPLYLLDMSALLELYASQAILPGVNIQSLITQLSSGASSHLQPGGPARLEAQLYAYYNTMGAYARLLPLAAARVHALAQLVVAPGVPRMLASSGYCSPACAPGAARAELRAVFAVAGALAQTLGRSALALEITSAELLLGDSASGTTSSSTPAGAVPAGGEGGVKQLEAACQLLGLTSDRLLELMRDDSFVSAAAINSKASDEVEMAAVEALESVGPIVDALEVSKGLTDSAQAPLTQEMRERYYTTFMLVRVLGFHKAAEAALSGNSDPKAALELLDQSGAVPTPASLGLTCFADFRSHHVGILARAWSRCFDSRPASIQALYDHLLRVAAKVVLKLFFEARAKGETAFAKELAARMAVLARAHSPALMAILDPATMNDLATANASMH